MGYVSHHQTALLIVRDRSSVCMARKAVKPLCSFSAIRLTSSNHVEEDDELIFIAGSYYAGKELHCFTNLKKKYRTLCRITSVCRFSPHLLMVLAHTGIYPQRSGRRFW